MLQSYHQSGECFEIIFNKTKYDALPPELQAILKYAAEVLVVRHVVEGDGPLFQGPRGDEGEQGVKVHKTPDAVLQAQLAAWDKVIATLSADPFFAKVIESQKAWAKRVVAPPVRHGSRSEDGLRSLLRLAITIALHPIRGGRRDAVGRSDAMSSRASAMNVSGCIHCAVWRRRGARHRGDLLVALCLWRGRAGWWPRRGLRPPMPYSSASMSFGEQLRADGARRMRRRAPSPIRRWCSGSALLPFSAASCINLMASAIQRKGRGAAPAARAHSRRSDQHIRRPALCLVHRPPDLRGQL